MKATNGNMLSLDGLHVDIGYRKSHSRKVIDH